MSEPGRGTVRTFLLMAIVTAVCGGAAAQDASNPTPQTSATAKPKKIWTNDDVAAAEPSSPGLKPGTTGPAKPAENNAKTARELRARLNKLEAQLKGTEKELQQLKDFQSGEGNGTAGHQLHKGYNMMPVPEQIEKLQAKTQQLQAQISAVYDEARKKGILPGQLR